MLWRGTGTNRHEVLDGSVRVVKARSESFHDLLLLKAHLDHVGDSRLESISGHYLEIDTTSFTESESILCAARLDRSRNEEKGKGRRTERGLIVERSRGSLRRRNRSRRSGHIAHGSVLRGRRGRNRGGSLGRSRSSSGWGRSSRSSIRSRSRSSFGCWLGFLHVQKEVGKESRRKGRSS
jgi:hypothetical protein